MSAPNTLYFGDNLDILRQHIATESVDLIYLDPPFNSKRDYNVLFKAPDGHATDAQLTAFEDSWEWGPQAEREFDEILHQSNTRLAELMQALRSFLHENAMLAYLTMMANRLLQLHRVLKPTGSLYLHCDPTASHYLKLVLDAVFGFESYQNEIIWKRSSTRSSISRIFRRAHDVILVYGKTKNYTFNLQYSALSDSSLSQYNHADERGNYQLVPLLVSGKRNGSTGQIWKGIDPNKQGRVGMHWVTTPETLEKYEAEGRIHWPQKTGGTPRLKYYLEDSLGNPMDDIWDDVNVIPSSSTESLGYPTQKPLALLERIIQASSNPGDVVLDPFCGCGTAVDAAQKLGRRWIGIDITHLAVSLIEKRLRDRYPGAAFNVEGTPRDVESARDLAERDKYQFQWWACSLVNAQPYQGKKKGADGGTDGLIFFVDEVGKPAKKAIVSVKGGANVQRNMVADLKNTVEREKAQLGLFVTLTPPTREMVKEAVSAGFYTSNGQQVQKIQILTIEELLGGKKPHIIDMQNQSLNFKKAKAEKTHHQPTLDL